MLPQVIVASLAEGNALLQRKFLHVGRIRAIIYCGEYVQLTNGLVGRLLDVLFDVSTGILNILLHHYPPAPVALVGHGGFSHLYERVVGHNATLHFA